MLGEYSLLPEFPELRAIITRLCESDSAFAKDYDALDKEIRELGLNGAPIDDEVMHQFKYGRAELKDSLYYRSSSQ